MTAGLDRATYLRTLQQEATALLDTAAAGPLDVAVPSCPGWTVERLVGHVGRVYRWTRSWIVEGRGGEIERAPSGPAVLAWTGEALTELADALEGADPEGTTATWAGEQPAVFWPRRMALETVVHRWDAEAAVRGTASPVAPDVAVDGIDEAFELILPGRAAEGLAALDAVGSTLHLHTTDVTGEWLLTFLPPPEHVRVEPVHGRADVAARGPASDLLLFLWNRAGPDDLEVFGDRSLLERWSDHVQV